MESALAAYLAGDGPAPDDFPAWAGGSWASGDAHSNLGGAHAKSLAPAAAFLDYVREALDAGAAAAGALRDACAYRWVDLGALFG